ncbi:MAG: ATP-binding protein [Syntrophales bacterium]|nr:ATP-binding protein [Syntrophales bacterium]
MGVIRLFKYNPGQGAPGEIEATFVARERVLKGIMQDLRERSRSASNQHYLIIGPRGIGKTNLLLMIKQQVLKEEALASAYLPVQTAEEEYSITGLRDLLTRVLELILQANPEDPMKEALQSINDTAVDEKAAEAAVSALREFSQKTGKKILLLMDNLDLVLGDQFTDEAQVGRLRDLLMNESFLVLVGAAPTYFREVSGYDRPLYNFFKTVHLEELSIEETTDLLKKRAEWDGNREFLGSLAGIKPRLKALHHLTGGNPRLALMLYQLYTQSALPEIRTALHMLLDDLTPYYKARLEGLPAQQRKVMDTFARLGRPATPTELAVETRLPVNQINSILKRLGEHGFVALAKQKRRKTTLYVVSERVFRIWHQMRFSTESRRRLEFLVDFIRIWYSSDQWVQETDHLLGEYRQHARERHLAEAGRYLEHLDYLIQGAPKLEMAYAVEDKAVRSCIEFEDCESARKMLEERIRRYTEEGNKDRLAESWYLMAYVNSVLGRGQEEIEALEKSVQFKPDKHEALYNWGVTLGDLAGMKEGGEREALLRDAMEKYARALQCKPDKHEALYNWGNALIALARLKEGEEREAVLSDAVEKYERALRIKPDKHEALNNWGNALGDLASMNEGREREELQVSALSKVATACNLARSARDERAISFYSAHYIYIALMACADALLADNRGRARTLFGEALERYLEADRDRARREIVAFFKKLTKEESAEQCRGFMAMMKKRDMNDELALLAPFDRAVEYWQKGKDEEVLDRLNPEVRKLVEQIVRNPSEKGLVDN